MLFITLPNWEGYFRKDIRSQASSRINLMTKAIYKNLSNPCMHVNQTIIRIGNDDCMGIDSRLFFSIFILYLVPWSGAVIQRFCSEI